MAPRVGFARWDQSLTSRSRRANRSSLRSSCRIFGASRNRRSPAYRGRLTQSAESPCEWVPDVGWTTTTEAQMWLERFSGLAAMDFSSLVVTGSNGVTFPSRRAALIDAILCEVIGRMRLMCEFRKRYTLRAAIDDREDL